MSVAALICGICVAGCQSASATGDRESRIPSFGIDEVPRQSEPPLENDGTGAGNVASSESADEDDDSEEEPAARKGNLLTRLLPGREKEPLERKPLPVNGRTAAADNEDEGDDDEEI
jgi:hypothetical protein